MRKVILRVLFILLPFLYSIYAVSQPRGKDCETNCFSAEVISAEKRSATCTAYEMRVSYSGNCAHELSHFTVALPCGKIQNIGNSNNWAHETGLDPTSGLAGFKIDNISGFGKGAMKSFTVTFELCASDEGCSAQLACWQPQVAFKAATCVHYQTAPHECFAPVQASIAKSDVSCPGGNDGSLSLAIEGGQAPYDILWSNQATTESISGLTAGHYSVVVRDHAGNEIALEETVGEPDAIQIGSTTVPASCNGGADGAIDLTVSGGEGTYVFLWNSGQTTEDLSGLHPGTYTVNVTDGRGCTASRQVAVGSGTNITVKGSHAKPDCNQSNGSIDISITGGAEPYNFVWSNGANTEDLDAIAAGLYTVTVTDARGCSGKASFLIRENNTLTLEGISSPTSCNDDASGAINLTPGGGTAPYTYLWSTGATSEDLSGLTSGSYRVTVTDQKTCTATAAFSVSKATFYIPTVVVHPTCYGEANGSITLGEPVGGTAPFTYEWSYEQHTGTSLENLGAGKYSVMVTDATGCSKTVTSTIIEPSELVATATVTREDCDGDGLSSIDLTVSGGTAPYTFEWSNGSTTEDIAGIEMGTYTVVITDARGCTVAREVVVGTGETPWSCTIGTPSENPACGSTGNMLSTPITDADSYQWTVESTDGSWVLTGASSAEAIYTSGGENTSATFTLTIVKGGCTRSCSITLSSCQTDDDGSGDDDSGEDPDGGSGGENPDDGGTDGENPDDGDNGEDPGDGDNHEEPGDGDGGGEHPGEEDPDGNDGEEGEGGNEDCESCFETNATLVEAAGECLTYEMVVSTNGLCRHELSHWTVALPCGSVSSYSNSEGWPMEIGKDPTTGLYGLKVDEINQFGKEADSFTVRFTLCGSASCLTGWSPAVAYKAGLCVGHEDADLEQTASAERVSAYPNPFSETINFTWEAASEKVNLQVMDQHGNIVSDIHTPTGDAGGYFITLESAHLPKGMYYYKLSVDGQTYRGKISKR